MEIEEDDLGSDITEQDDQQLTFPYVSELKEWWIEEWRGMPEFVQDTILTAL